MMRTWYFIGLTVLAIGAAAWLARLRVQPVPLDWLIEHGDCLRCVGEYAEAEPVMLRWQKSLPDPAMLADFVLAARERPYAFLPPAALRDLATQATDERIDAGVRHVAAVLLSPCSSALKNSVLDDPLGLASRMDGLISPASTASAPALFVCTFGATKEMALRAAETADCVLATLQSHGAIGPFIGASTFLYSTNHLASRLGELARSLDSFRLAATMEHALDSRSLDRALFRRFFDTMRLIGGQTNAPDSVSIQQRRLAARGLDPLVRYFFMRHRDGYVCVHRVMPAAGTTVADARRAIVPALGPEGIAAVATSPEHVVGQFRHLVTVALWVVGVLWAVGVLVPLAAGMVHGIVLRVLMGRHAFVKVWTLQLAPGFQSALKACGLAEYIDLACIAAPARRAGAPMYDMTVVRDGAHGAVPGMRTWLVHLPAHPSLPAAWRAHGACTLRVTRAEGHRAASMRAEYRNLMRMRRRGIPVEPVVAFGDGLVDGRRCAVMAVLVQDGYVPFDQWQARMLAGGRWCVGASVEAGEDNPLAPFSKGDLERRENTTIEKGKAVADIAQLVRRMHARGFRCPAPRDTCFLVGENRVRLAALGGVVRASIVRRLLEVLVPPLARAARQRDYRALNRILFMEFFSGRDRVRLYRLCENRAKLDSSDKTFIRMLARGDDAHLYAQYVRCGDLTVNMAESTRLARAPAHSFDEYMALQGGRRVTKKRGRTVFAIEVDGEPWYLKRHTPPRMFDAVRLWREYGRNISHARAEWEANARLCALGMHVVPLVVMGERAGAGSFIATAELPHGRSLEALLAQQPALTQPARCELARRLGSLAFKLHDAGLVHRDFYLGHLYIVGDLGGTYRIHLLDAQRLRHGAVPGNRWSLKDLTALHFSSLPLGAIRPKDRLRVLHHYFRGVPWRLVKPIARRISAKAARVARHTDRLLTRRKRRGELPACILTFITL